MGTSITTSKNQFPALTGVRGIAAFMVFFCHLPLHLHYPALQHLQFSFSATLTFFYVLSGFLITYRYYPTFTLSGTWFKTYFVNRFARIYPVYFLLVTIVIIARGYYGFSYLAENYTLTHSLFSIAHVAIGPSWSLTVEECFYILAPFIMLSAKRASIWFPLGIYFVVLACILLSRDNKPDVFTANLGLLMLTIIGRFFEFFTGAFVAIYLLRRSITDRKGMRYTLAGGLGMLACMCAIAWFFTATGIVKYASIILIYNFLMPIPVITFYYGLMTERTWMSRLLSTKPLDLFGKSSYALYLIHMPMIELFLPQVRLLRGIQYNLLVFSIFLLCVLLSVILYKWYEAPLHTYIKKLFLKRNSLSNDPGSKVHSPSAKGIFS